ncbi:UEV-domain-containing protein [Dipodascopsis tothii]|uniref:UEV-domain-containing protein n=1 Tax=Dipodascopsis tothii TaxID=44089 RepID=UPI0034CE19F8
MARPLPQQTLQWLHTVLLPEYKDVNRTFADTVKVLETYPSLAPRTSVYTHENGKSQLLLNLKGTLPVSFRSSSYNIPIDLWVPHEYPQAAPFAFVVPTQTMGLRPGNHVDTNGRCYHPFLSYWHEQPGASIAGVCTVLADVFSKEPPVYAKPAEAATPAPPPAAPAMDAGLQRAPQYAAQPPVAQPAYAAPPGYGYNPTPPSLPMHPDHARVLNDVQADFQRRAAQFQAQGARQVESMKTAVEMLSRAQRNVDVEQRELVRSAAAFEANKQILADKIAQAERVIQDAQTRPDVDIDEVVCAETAAFNQLYELVADDLAIDDTIYVLGKALDRERVRLDVFLKHTRTLAREQFLKRALVKKISLETGLA